MCEQTCSQPPPRAILSSQPLTMSIYDAYAPLERMGTATGACGRPPECLYMHLSNFSLFLVDLAGCLYPQTVSVFRIQASQLSTQTAVSADSCILKYPNPWIQLFGSILKYPSIHEAPGLVQSSTAVSSLYSARHKGAGSTRPTSYWEGGGARSCPA